MKGHAERKRCKSEGADQRDGRSGEQKLLRRTGEMTLNDLSGLLKTFLNRDDSPERVRIRKDYEAGAALTGKGGIRQRLGAVDMEFFGRAYFPHYFSRPSPEFHRELDAIWQDGVLKGLTPSTPKLVKQISRMNGCKRVVAAPVDMPSLPV